MKNQSQINIPSHNLEELLELFSNYESITKVVLFGSRARGDNKLRSDIDLAIWGDSKDIRTLSYMIDEESKILLHVDLIEYESLESEKMKYNINQEGVTIYTKSKKIP
jgi:uncharacterized protein